MDGEQLPKATMNAYIKSHSNLPFSPDYLSRVLQVAKGIHLGIIEFIVRVSDKANIMCQSYSKKTINAEHLEAALKDFGINQHLGELKRL